MATGSITSQPAKIPKIIPDKKPGAGAGGYAASIFLSAFLLFQVQLLIGKYILPWFGGATGVWATCLLFFQVLLLLGYSYAHWLSSKFEPSRQFRIHAGLVAASLVLLLTTAFAWHSPITPGASWKPTADTFPLWRILGLLTASVGVPFLLLSTTGPLLQRWFTYAEPGQSPYRLYALSNLGSLLGLLTYPFLFEPVFRLTTQAWLWTAGYLAFAAGVMLCGRRTARAAESGTNVPAEENSRSDFADSPGWKRRAAWIGLPACASVMLLAVTQTICQDVGVLPLLWVLPLAIYLTSFIICFEHERWYQRGFFHLLLAAAVVTTLLVESPGPWKGLPLYIGVHLFVLFAGCMFCHGEVYRLRPAPRHLTRFYLSVALGGALGGIFVNLIAPLIFRGYWELQLGLFACFAIMAAMVIRDKSSWANRHVLWLPLAFLLWGYWTAEYLTNLTYKDFTAYMHTTQAALLFALASLVTVLAVFNSRIRPGSQPSARMLSVNVPRLVRLCLVLAVAFVGTGLMWLASERYRSSLWSVRNFYGVLYVYQVRTHNPHFNSYVLMHGRIEHGLQMEAPDQRMVPTSYFGPRSGVGLLLLNFSRTDSANPGSGRPRSLRVGVIGLGVGTLAAYGRPGDLFRFYEINPAVISIAAGEHGYFSYLQNSSARVQVVGGDARISLERELQRGEAQKFDVLIVDAFNSDAIPVHLLTQEAFQLYHQHLRGPESVIAIHVSNRNLHLAPVVAKLASHFHLYAANIESEGLGSIFEPAHWVLLSQQPNLLQQRAIQQASSPIPPKEFPLWTDDYSNLLQLF